METEVSQHKTDSVTDDVENIRKPSEIPQPVAMAESVLPVSKPEPAKNVVE